MQTRRALVGIVAALVVAGTSLVAQSQTSQQVQASNTKGDATKQNQTNPIPPINITVTTPEPSTAEKDAQRQRADRQDATNANIARFTFYLVIVGIFDVIAIFIGLGYTARAANAAKKSADVADRTLRVTQRAFVSLVEIQLAKDHFKPGAHFPNIVMQFKNTGHLHASPTSWATIVLTDEQLPETRNAAALVWRSTSGVIGRDQIITMSQNTTANRGFSVEEWNKLLLGKYQLHIYGAIRYGVGFENEPEGETGFAFSYDAAAAHLAPNRRFVMNQTQGYNYAK